MALWGECFLFHACAVAVASSVVLGSLLPVSGLADDLLRVTQVKKALPSPTAPEDFRSGTGPAVAEVTIREHKVVLKIACIFKKPSGTFLDR